MRILVVNAGSSSLKLRLLGEGDELLGSADLGPVTSSLEVAEAARVRAAIAGLGPVDAVGHRIVHGGTELQRAVRLDEPMLARIEALTELAPLHQPAAVAAARLAMTALPGVPHVGCFDTAFHATLPAAAATYALPAAWRDRWGLRRFGFHGLSHAYAARRAAELLGRPLESLQLVTCHLGAGASLTAVREGRSVDTTMGFTPLEGIVMATRSGSVDPGLLLWLQSTGRVSLEELSDGLEERSGLLGMAGTADMRQVLEGATAGHPDSVLARDVYLHRLRAGIAGMAAALDRLDAIVFTGGVGEHAPAIRAGAIDGLALLGARLDTGANDRAAGDGAISRPGQPGPAILVVESREDLEIARQVRQAVAA